MKITVHLNDRVRIRLRPSGEALLRGVFAVRPEHLKADKTGYITVRLAEVMFLFGRQMGAPTMDLEIDPTMEIVGD